MVLGGSTEDRHSIYCRYPPEPGVLLLDCNNSARLENSLMRTLEGRGVWAKLCAAARATRREHFVVALHGNSYRRRAIPEIFKFT